MKRVVLSLLSAIAVISSSLFGVESASAAVFPNTGTVTYTVGESVNLNLGCGESGITSVTFNFGNLPDGLSISSTGVVTGSPTTVGEYTLTGYNCNYGGGGVGWAFWSLTFHINPIVTPDPILSFHSLNTSDCQFYIGSAFPVTPDPNSVSIKIENQSGTVYIENPQASFTANQLKETAATPANLNEWPLDSNFSGSFSGSEPFRCGDTLSATLSYQWHGAPAATKTISGIVVESTQSQGGSAPVLKAIAMDNSSCQFRIIGAVNSTAQAGSTKITLDVPGASVNTVAMTVKDSAVTGMLDFTLTPDSNTNLLTDSIEAISDIESYSANFDSITCNNNINVTLEYRDVNGKLWTATSTVVPTKPDNAGFNNDFTVIASRSNSGLCSINVVAKVPDVTRPVYLDITSLNGENSYANMTFTEGFTGNGVIMATMSLAREEDMSANVPIASKSINSDLTCVGYFKLVLSSNAGRLAETVFSLDIRSCNAGFTINSAHTVCTIVPVGFWAPDIDMTEALPCPTGMTTEEPGARSLNDCYTPIAQTIPGFTSPKSLKFKATTNLLLTTNLGTIANFRVSGPCTASQTTMKVKVAGKLKSVKVLNVKAASKAGACVVTLTALATGRYLALSKVTSIKVSKTGK